MSSAGNATAYENLIASFSRPWMAAFYVLMMLLIALHVFSWDPHQAQDLGAMDTASGSWLCGWRTPRWRSCSVTLSFHSRYRWGS